MFMQQRQLHKQPIKYFSANNNYNSACDGFKTTNKNVQFKLDLASSVNVGKKTREMITILPANNKAV